MGTGLYTRTEALVRQTLKIWIEPRWLWVSSVKGLLTSCVIIANTPDKLPGYCWLSVCNGADLYFASVSVHCGLAGIWSCCLTDFSMGFYTAEWTDFATFCTSAASIIYQVPVSLPPSHSQQSLGLFSLETKCLCGVPKRNAEVCGREGIFWNLLWWVL